MDPITAAILAGLAAGATKVGERALTDAYSVLRRLIQRKFGTNSELERAVQSVEANPGSAGRRSVLEEEVVGSGAAHDGELRAAANRVLSQVQSMPGGQQIIQEIHAGRWVVGGNIDIGPGSAFVGGDVHSNFTVDEFSSKTNIGCAFKTIGIVLFLAGFAVAGYTMYELISDMPDVNDGSPFDQSSPLDEGFPDGFVVAGVLLFSAIIFSVISKLIDETLSRRH